MGYISYRSTDCEARASQPTAGVKPRWQQTASDQCRTFKPASQQKGPGGSEEPPEFVLQSSACRQLPQSNLSSLHVLAGHCILMCGRSFCWCAFLLQAGAIIIINIYHYYYIYCLLVGFQCPESVCGCFFCGLSGRQTFSCSVCLSLVLPKGWHRFPWEWMICQEGAFC